MIHDALSCFPAEDSSSRPKQYKPGLKRLCEMRASFPFQTQRNSRVDRGPKRTQVCGVDFGDVGPLPWTQPQLTLVRVARLGTPNVWALTRFRLGLGRP